MEKVEWQTFPSVVHEPTTQAALSQGGGVVPGVGTAANSVADAVGGWID